MILEKTASARLFTGINYIILSMLALICVLPMIHLLAISFSDKFYIDTQQVSFIPMGIQFENYKFMIEDERFLNSFFNSVLRVVIGTTIQMLMITITAYPLCREQGELKGRNAYMWFLVFPMLFSGGLIPTYLLVREVGLLNSFWVLVIGPIIIPIFSIILMMNFFRQLPKDLYESALIDGANQWRILVQIYLPLSMPAIATLTLFSIVQHWNQWFDALIYINDIGKWPVQTLLRSFLSSEIDYSNLPFEEIERLSMLSDQGLKAAQVFIVTLPILIIYPFLQKYFVKGIVLGSVKG